MSTMSSLYLAILMVMVIAVGAPPPRVQLPMLIRDGSGELPADARDSAEIDEIPARRNFGVPSLDLGNSLPGVDGNLGPDWRPPTSPDSAPVIDDDHRGENDDENTADNEIDAELRKPGDDGDDGPSDGDILEEEDNDHSPTEDEEPVPIHADHVPLENDDDDDDTSRDSEESDRGEDEKVEEDEEDPREDEDKNYENGVLKGSEEDEGEAGSPFQGGFIFDTPFFNVRQISKYFQQLERALEHVFQHTMDESTLLNGTYANTTEEEVEIHGKKYLVQKSIIKGRDNNSSIYVEALSSMPKMNRTKVVKDSGL